MNKRICVLRVDPWTAPRTVTIPNTLDALQAIVGGHIQAVPLEADVELICNEEGKLMGLPPNRQVGCDIIVGTFLVVGVSGENFSSLPDEKMVLYKMLFS